MANDYLSVLTPEELIKILKTRVKKDWDAVIGITGEEGSSKSTLASWLVYQGCLYDGMTEDEALEKFVEYTIFSPNKDRVQEQITKSTRYSVVNADEAIKILYKQNWATPIQKFLNMFYALCRQENKISILCMPRFLDFNEFFRNHRIKFWIHVLDRGVGVMFEKDWFPASADPWFLKSATKMNEEMYKRKHTSDFNIDEKIAALSKLKNFVGVVRFEDLPTKLKNAYKKGKAQYAYEDLDEQVKGGQIAPGAKAEQYHQRAIQTAHNLREKGMDVKDIARIMNVNTRTIYSYLKKDSDSDSDSIINNKQSSEDYFDDSMEEDNK